MKIKNGKKFVRTIALALAATVCVVSCSSVMISSYVSYNDYYNTLMEEKEHQKYLQSLPLVCLGITAELNDGKEYYTDGLANPTADDFAVTAHFTEKGKDFDKILSSSDFEISVPENFAQNGGKVTVKYVFTPTKANEADPDPEPVEKTADVEISLTRVALRKLEIKEMPYRVYYSDAMPFSTEGMSCTAYYNNGKTAIVPASALEADTTNNLTAGTESVPVSFTLDGVTISADVPVKVDAAAEYAEGEALSIRTEGNLTVTEGQTLSNLTLPVRATYTSGNRLLLSDGEYEVVGNTANASFLYNCILTVSLNADPTIVCKTAATVSYATEAESTTVNACTQATVDEYAGDTKIGTATVIKDFASNATLSFAISATGVAKGKFYIRLANTGTDDVALADVLSMKVNGTTYYASKTLVATANGGNCEFAQYRLPDAILRSGSNAIEIGVKSGATVAIDRFLYETRYEGTFYSSVGEYIAMNENPQLTSGKVADWNNNEKPYMHGLCTDGTYIYAASTSWSQGARAIVVKKYNAETGAYVRASQPTEAKSSETFAGVAYIDGKIITFMSDGTEYAIDPSLSGSWQPYTGLDFKGYETASIYDAAYVAEKQTYVLRTTEFGITLFDKSGEKTGQISIGAESGLSLKRTSVYGGYVYAVYTTDGQYQPVVRMYDFEGNLIRRFVVPNTVDVGTIVAETRFTNVQGMTVVNDTLYFSVLKFGSDNGGDMTMILRADYPEIPERLEYSLTCGEYIAECAAAGVSASATAGAVYGSIGEIADTSGYAMGGVSDGEYFYLATNGGSNLTATLYKVNPSTGEVVAKTNSFNVAADGTSPGDNARLFIKDGTLYCVGGRTYDPAGALFAIDLKDFTGTKAVVKEVDLSFSFLGTPKDVAYSADADRFAVITHEGKLHILDGEMGVIQRDIALSGGFSSVAADDKYVYVSYCYNNQTSVNVAIYDWDGNTVGTYAFTGVSLGDEVQYNIQSIFVHNSELYATVCSWTGGHMKLHLWKVTCDLSVFG